MASRREQVLALASITALGAACGSSSTPAEPDASTVGEDVTVTAFSGAHVYFAGEDDRRAVDPAPRLALPDTGCALGTGCEYDGGAHTEPRYQLSALLVLLR